MHVPFPRALLPLLPLRREATQRRVSYLIVAAEFRGSGLDSWLPTKAFQPTESEDSEHGDQLMRIANQLASFFMEFASDWTISSCY